MDEESRIFAVNVRQFIAESGKTQKEVALELGYNPTTFNTWCVGKILPKSGKIQKIADYFGVPKSALTDKEIDPKDVVMATPNKEEREVLEAYRKLTVAEKAIVRRSLGL